MWDRLFITGYYGLIVVARSDGFKVKNGRNDGFVYLKQTAFHVTQHELMESRYVDYLWIIVMFLSAV